jgi:hypothetical protein
VKSIAWPASVFRPALLLKVFVLMARLPLDVL